MGVQVLAGYTHTGGEEVTVAVECDESSEPIHARVSRADGRGHGARARPLDEVAGQAVKRCAELVGLLWAAGEAAED